MNRKYRMRALVVAVALIAGGLVELVPRAAHAIIGRPLTPLSYAGVARRTTRRAVRRGAFYGGAAVGVGAYGAAVAAPVVAAPVVAAPVVAPRPVVVW